MLTDVKTVRIAFLQDALIVSSILVGCELSSLYRIVLVDTLHFANKERITRYR